MAKRTYKILRFDGGINNDADPRDIGDNQFSELQNVAVDEMGKIVVLGDIQTTRKSVSGILTGVGNGLFACTTDHDGLLDGTVATPGQTYYLVENGDTITGIGEDGETPSPTLDCTIGSAGPTMYYVDGALRIADADHTGGTVPVWRGFIKDTTYFPGADGATDVEVDVGNTWVTENAEIAGCFPTFESTTTTTRTTMCRNAIMLNVNGGGLYGFNNETVDTVDTNWDGTNDAGTGANGLHWGIALAFNESGSNGAGTWMPQTSVRYKFFVTTMYDNHTQESLPQLFRMFDSYQARDDGDLLGDIVRPEMYFTNGITSAIGENIASYFGVNIKVHSSGTYNFGSSAETSTSGGNQRISGLRVYWSSNEDSYTTLWQMFDCKFDEGCRLIGPDGGGGGILGYTPWAYGGASQAFAGSVKWTNPPRYFQYDVLNAHAATDVIKVDSYKAAVVANRRVYLGNIRQDGEIHGDRMLKSPVNQFDKFPSVNNIDVAIHDGDEIVALIEYADRILQFKKNTCYIINVSGNTEYLEAEHKFKGITNPGAACRMDYGVAWVNQNGCYLYNGEQVTDLLEGQGMRKINQSAWSTFIGTDNYHRIGFNPFKRQLVVLQGSTGNDAYVYDMVTKSWTFSANMVESGNTDSNFINDPVDGSLLIFNDNGNTIDKWADTPVGDTTPPIVITTKDIDFGEPAVRKKLYKIYVTYKGDGSSITENYRTNGGTTDFGFDAGFGNVSVWTRLELKPDTSSEANSIYSCQLRLTGSCATNFMINDISFIYRTKGIK
jgi:hypothetical protein